jgi:dihydroorotate dehydrogenase (NAD+) catalytic subunit
MTASGTFGYGIEYAKVVDVEGLGAIVCKATTLDPREGNPQPRLAETAAGMLNSIGLQNVGVKAVIAEKAPQWARWRVPVIVNIAGESVAEFVKLAELLDGVPGVAGLELNISCPNVEAGMQFAVSSALAADVTAAVKAKTALPVVVKLSPNVTDIVPVALAVARAGADAVSLINTLVGMLIDVRARRPMLGAATGGLSGPAIMPVALRMVYQVAQAFREAGIDVPIVGIGGIGVVEDALQFLMAGASAVQVGTATFVNPKASLEIVAGLERYVEEEGIGDIGRIIGVALPK